MRLVIMSREDQGLLGAVRELEVPTEEGVLDVVLGSPHWAMLGISMSSLVEDTGKSASRLHSFRWSVGQCRFVDRGPAPIPRVVAQQAGPSVAFP